MLINKIIVIFLICLISLNAHSQIDPTKPSQYRAKGNSISVKAASTSLNLEVIKLLASKRVAVINGRTYNAGQYIGKEQVKTILLDKVIFRSGKELHLFGHSVVKISK